MARKNPPIKLKRPLAFLDLETTGLIIGHDRIVEIAILKVHPDGRRTKYSSLVNPEMRIPSEAYRVHGISDRSVERSPRFKRVGKKLVKILKECDLAGFNLRKFDLPILQEEFRRIGIEFSLKGRAIIDACQIFHYNEPRDLAAAYRFYCNAEIEDAHSALGDARACLEILYGQLKRYTHLPRSLPALHSFCNPSSRRYVDSTGKFEWRDGEAVFLFGKNKGRTLHQVAEEQPDDLEWILGQDFPSDVQKIVRNALRGKFPKKHS